MAVIAVSSILLVSFGGGGAIYVFAQTVNLAAVSSITDLGTFGSIIRVRDIHTVTVDSNPYALVTTFENDNSGMIIIDISNPAKPMAVSTITGPGTELDNEFRNPNAIETVTINSTPYALVTAFFGDSVNIVNLSNPLIPTITSSIRNGTSDRLNAVFDTLDGNNDLAITKIGLSTYAVIVSTNDNGIQIIDITNPADPLAVSSVTDGDVDSAGNTFDTLDSPSNITITKIGSSTYALVATFTGSGVQIIDITNPADPLAVYSVTDAGVDSAGNTFDALGGSFSVTTVSTGSSTYALIASLTDDGVQIIDITNPADPLAVSSVTDAGVDSAGNIFDTLDGSSDITTVSIGSSTYALVASSVDRGVQIINITNPADPLVAASVTDGDTDSANNPFDTLDDSRDISVIEIDSFIYALVTSNDDNGVQIIRITENQPDLEEPITVGFNLAITSTMFITQSNPSTITFNDATVDVFLDDTGKGTFEYASLIDGTIVTTRNLGSNVIQFTLDPAGPYNDRNPDQAGMPDEDPFQIQNFQSGVHTVMYNKTHFTFNFDDPSFTGLTPAISFQAATHTAADALPAVDSDLANITFNITDTPPACETTLGAISLDFGTVNVGDTTPVDGGTVVVRNTGAVSADVNIGAGHWCEGPCFTGVTSFPVQMLNSQTSFSQGAGTLYAAKTAFTVHGYGVDNGAIIRGSTSLPFVTPPLFTLAANTEGTAYLQTNVVLDIMPSTAINTFTGDLEQEIIIESECS